MPRRLITIFVSDKDRLDDELVVMGEVYTTNEFVELSYDNEKYVTFNAHPSLPANSTLLLKKDNGKADFKVNYLPPIRLVAKFPRDYPSQSPPEYYLSCSWLSVNKLAKLVEQLESLWDENKCEILFIWCSFLKDESLKILQIVDCYDLDEWHPIHLENVEQNVEVDGLESYRKEAVNKLYNDMIEHNDKKSKEEFNKQLQDCIVCFCRQKGALFKQLSCGHATCVECLRQMFQVHIKDGTIECIKCCKDGCGLEMPTNIIQELLPKELFEKYSQLMLNRTLETSNMTYCPRTSCQHPVDFEANESLGICPNCSHPFCVYCKRTYHGVEECKINSDEKLKIIELYQNGSYKQKLGLEKRYGKKLLTSLVSEANSKMWMSKNSKQCPCCHVKIEKSDGCNKMICKKCNANFCWICQTRICSLNPYLHYQDPNSKCFNLLFEGMFVGNEEPENGD